MPRDGLGRPRRPISFTAFTAIAGFTILSLSQCATPDRLMGVTIERVAPTTCVRHCQDLYDGLFASEHKRHEAQIQVCNSLSQSLRTGCLLEEETRHQAAMDQLTQGKIACLDECRRPPG